MASTSSLSKVDPARATPRTSSIDSAVSAISSRAPSQQGSQDDVANLIRAAGTPEAVIQYLLKEKHSQSQQNTQLWRLVDKQRAMILGLNKDLDRALKDKEKYRKKLKEVVAMHDEHARPNEPNESNDVALLGTEDLPTVEVKVSEPVQSNAPRSPLNLDSDSTKHSPVDMNLAPYPITPPADRIPHDHPSKVQDMLDPTHAMPKPSEHALDHFDHEEQDRVADAAKMAANAAHELPIHIGLPQLRDLPSQSQRESQPKPPTVSIIEATPLIDQGISQFPPPPAPPPRKPPPAPLRLKEKLGVTRAAIIDDEIDSESDYDSVLEVDDVPATELRGRRRTREDDDREREVIAQQEAEARSLSKKSKKGSQKGTPISEEARYVGVDVPVSPRTKVAQPLIVRDNVPASLAGVLSGNEPHQKLHPALMSPGLPSSPRPTAFFSPPLSPRGMPSAGPLSPKAPRQPIPFPPNTPRFNAGSAEPLNLTSPKAFPPTKQMQGAKQPQRTEIYRGLMSEEYPDLLLHPNALPSVAVKVASSRMRPSRASLISLTQLEEDPVFTLAIVSRSGDAELWRVEKDTSSLAKLDQRMKQCSSFTARTPDRSLFTGHAPAKLDARRTVLDNYLDELLNTLLDLATAVELCRYLSTNALPPGSDDHSLPHDSSGENSPQKGPDGRPLKSGYLTKRGKNFGGWKARFFVLDSPNLRYFEAPGGAHLGTIKLQNAQIGKQAQQNTDGSPAGGSNGEEPDNQYRHAFLVLEPKKKDATAHVKHVLCAESDQERDQWVDALLRWIDYRDQNEDESSLKHGTHGHGSQAHVIGANTKKKMHGQGKPVDLRNENQEALIGMSYDTAKQGDLPDGAPPRRRGTASPELLEKPASSLYMISAPRDPHIISDSAMWGSKTSLLPPGPSVEEKKQRKRSFFGFGPKTRSSADDQDLLYNSSGGSTPQPQLEPRGPGSRQAFGAPLAEAVRYCGPADVNVPLPAVVYRCIQYLDFKDAILEEGIFRLSGSSLVIKQLRERFNQEGDVNLLTDETYYDIHAVASLLKLYLRELPTTILTRDLHMDFVAVTEMTNHREKIAAFSELVQRLPLANETILKYLIAFLIKIINHSDINKMTVRNVGIVFSPTLNIPAPVFALLLQNYQGIFGIEPEEYELPSPVSEADSRPPTEAQPRRPSTAGTTESPHRQRLVEQVQQRSTPTPPGFRLGGTPPPRQAAHQGLGAQATARPAYENGFSIPPNHDSTAATAPAFRQPTYDRPHYGYESSYEQDNNTNSNGMLDASFSNKSKRRESAMFMGNVVNHQTSNSRLRDETRM